MTADNRPEADDSQPLYEVVNTSTGVAETEPLPPARAKDQLREKSEKLHRNTETPLYLPVNLKLRRVET